MEREFNVNYNFYGDIKNDTLPHDYNIFLNLIAGKYELKTDDVSSFYYELENSNHRFFRITQENFFELSKTPNATIHIYFSEAELKSNQQINNNESIKIGKDQVIENIVSKIKKLRAIKAEKEKEKENKPINSLEDIINKKIKDLTAELIKEANMGVSTIIENSRLEKIQEFEKKNNKKICVSVHNGITCNGCNQQNIKGIRYKCTICPEFNYCEKCEEKLGEKHLHPFFKLRFEIE